MSDEEIRSEEERSVDSDEGGESDDSFIATDDSVIGEDGESDEEEEDEEDGDDEDDDDAEDDEDDTKSSSSTSSDDLDSTARGILNEPPLVPLGTVGQKRFADVIARYEKMIADAYTKKPRKRA